MKHVGDTYKTNGYGNLVITKYVDTNEVHVKFVNTGYETVSCICNIKTGRVKDKSLPTVHGVGIVGEEVTKVNGKQCRVYGVWCAMIQRCYDEKFLQRHPTYKGCSVSDNFKYYPYFKDWYNRQIGSEEENWQLDKDILIKGNKVYSEDTCVLVPPEVNTLILKRDALRGVYPIGVSFHKKSKKFVAQIKCTGIKKHIGLFCTPEQAFYAYKEAKEEYVKAVANKWRNEVDFRVYEALMDYQVEITD